MRATTLPRAAGANPGLQTAVILVTGLRKRYGNVDAVRGVDLAVQRGEVFAFLGPNGAGKTTTVEMLEGYRRRDAGDVQVLGVDPARPTLSWRARIGVVLQTSHMPPELTVHELVQRYAGYYPRPRDVAETIDRVGLSAKRKARAGSLSGGQQRRLDVALALVGDPDLVFLDEPTTGFDPAARRQAWGLVESLKPLGKTVFLTTHYMDEAEALADRVAVIAAGVIVAEGTPHSLGGREEAPAEIRFRRPAGMDPRVLLGDAVRCEDGWVSVRVPQPTRALWVLQDWAREHGVSDLAGLEVRRPSLEDIYLDLVGGERR
jgi:ABC-2 type transport system ATP-binding protein